jgi:hypothetical protein
VRPFAFEGFGHAGSNSMCLQDVHDGHWWAAVGEVKQDRLQS